MGAANYQGDLPNVGRQAASMVNSPSSGPPEARPWLPLLRPDLPPLESYTQLLEEIWVSGILSNFDTFAKRFEAQAAAYTGEPECLAVVNCDVGLTLAIAALQPRPGSEAIVPSFTFPSTVNAIRWNGLRPRFADTDPISWCLDPASVASRISVETGLIVGMHTFGAAGDVNTLTSHARSAGVPLVFDAAHAIGTWVGERHIASFGDASVFSFSGTKVVTSGEGGLAVFRDPGVAERFRYLRNYGFRGDYIPRFVGLNGKLSELHAALGCLTLERVEDAVRRRAARTSRYRELLGGSVGFQSVRSTVRPTHAYLAIDAGDRRDELAAHLAENGIETKKYFRPLHLAPALATTPPEPLPATEQLAARLLCLPLFPDLGIDDLERVCATILTQIETAE